MRIPSSIILRSSSRSGSDNKYVATVLAIGTECDIGYWKQRSGSSCLATTNTPYALDQAIRSRMRFDKRIYIPLPDLKARQHMFKVKDVFFEPVSKSQDAMFVKKTPDGMWMRCGPKQPGSIRTTMQDLAAKGLAAQGTCQAAAGSE